MQSNMIGDILQIIDTFERSGELNKTPCEIQIPVLDTTDGLVSETQDLTHCTSKTRMAYTIPENVGYYTEIGTGSDSAESDDSLSNDEENTNNKNSGDTEWSDSPVSDENNQNNTLHGLKQSLKDKIKIRRESEGAELITNLFEPPREYKLTPEEERKNEIRKERNRRSATKSRLKRIEREKKLEKEHEKLEEENTELQEEVKRLLNIKTMLQMLSKCVKHSPACQVKSLHLSSVLQPIQIPLSSLPERMRAAVKRTSVKEESIFLQQENVQKCFQGNGFGKLLKRKSADPDFHKPSKFQTVSMKTAEEVFSEEECDTSEVPQLGDNSKSFQSAKAEIQVGGKIGATFPLQSTEVSSVMLQCNEGLLNPNISPPNLNCLKESGCRRPPNATYNSQTELLPRNQDCKSEERLSCSCEVDSRNTVSTVSDEDCHIQTIANTVTSSSQSLSSSLSFTSVLNDTSHSQLPSFDLPSFDLSVFSSTDSKAPVGLPSLTGYKGSTNTVNQENDKEAQINYIKNHLFDDLHKTSCVD